MTSEIVSALLRPRGASPRHHGRSGRATSTRRSNVGADPVAATSTRSRSILRNSNSAVCDPVRASSDAGTGGSTASSETSPTCTLNNHNRYNARRSPARSSARTGRIEASTPSPPHSKSPASSSDTAATTT